MRRVVVMCLGLLAGFLAPRALAREVVLEPAHTFVEDDPAMEKALRDELGRSMKDLHLPEQPQPYYLAYAVADTSQALVSATYGAVTTLNDYRGRSLRTELRVGSAAFDNANFSDGFSSEARLRPCRSTTTTRPCAGSSGCVPTRLSRTPSRPTHARSPR
jgi:hypothetical protein